MLLIEEITDDPKQQHTLVLPDGSQLLMQIEYKPQQYGWFFTTLQYKTLTINGMRIVSSPNILYQFKNQIPFGIGCFVDGNQEPTQLEDFLNTRAKLYILTAAEVLDYVSFLRG